MKRNRFVFCGLILFLFWLLLLQLKYRFQFFYMEQLQLFPLNSQSAIEIIGQIGGLSLYLSRFLVQFFVLPWGGGLIVALLLTVISLLIRIANRRFIARDDYFILSVLPALALFPVVIDPNYFLQGVIAYLFALTAFIVYSKIQKFKLRLLTGILLVFFLHLTTGSACVLFAVCILIRELLDKPSRYYLSFGLLAEALLLGFLSVRLSLVGDFRFAFLPDAYGDPLMQTSNKYYWGWIAWPACMIIVFVLSKKNQIKRKRLWIAAAFQLILLGGITYWIIKKWGLSETLQYREMSHYAYTKEWGKLLSVKMDEFDFYPKMNLVNYALARQGRLGDDLFGYDQRGVQSLVCPWDNSINLAISLSDIYIFIGDIASAQKYAFEGNVCSVNAGSSRLLKRLVETNLIFGAYPVAEKYISILEQTLFYKDWAKSMRHFLYNDQAVKNDKILGSKYKGLFGKYGMAVSQNMIQELEFLAVNNPSDQTALHYLTSLFLVNKDLGHFKGLMEKYYQTNVWPQAAISQQQAVIFLAPEDRKYWIQHGVSGQTEQTYTEFEKTLIFNNGRSDTKQIMEEKYGNTFWYYLLFKK